MLLRVEELVSEVEEELVLEVGDEREDSWRAAKFALAAGWSMSASNARSAIC